MKMQLYSIEGGLLKKASMAEGAEQVKQDTPSGLENAAS